MLEGMTYDLWRSLNERQRKRVQDTTSLNPQLLKLEGCRVEVVTSYGETRRFRVGRSGGWRPIHLELKNIRSSGGCAAEESYKSVRVIRSN
jgi:hypothetical protein